ncbi:hypothetical protein GCM10027592_51050 [Spirosoma flavus]
MERTTTVLYPGQSLCQNIVRLSFEKIHRNKYFGIVLFLTLYGLGGLTSLRAQTANCPTITNTSMISLTICTGNLVDSLQVNTTAVLPNQIEFVRFDTLYANPYKGRNGVHLGEINTVNGKATQYAISFPPHTGTTDRVYYVYACLKPEPDSTCAPFALITVFVKPNPTANVVVKEATCFGSVSQADGQVSISGYAPTDTYEVSNNGTFTGTGQPIPNDGVIVSGISRTGTPTIYSVRIYNSQGCYVDKYATVLNRQCDCPPSKCLPITVLKAE